MPRGLFVGSVMPKNIGLDSHIIDFAEKRPSFSAAKFLKVDHEFALADYESPSGPRFLDPVNESRVD